VPIQYSVLFLADVIREYMAVYFKRISGILLLTSVLLGYTTVYFAYGCFLKRHCGVLLSTKYNYHENRVYTIIIIKSRTVVVL
jgi:hypothetical protein